MIPNWPWTHNSNKERLTSEAERLVGFTLRTLIVVTQGRQKSEMHRMTPSWTWILNSQKYFMYTTYLPQRPKVFCFAPRLVVSEIQGRLKFEMNGMISTSLEHLTVKSTLSSPNTSHGSPNFGPFRSTISGFEDTNHRKLECTE